MTDPRQASRRLALPSLASIPSPFPALALLAPSAQTVPIRDSLHRLRCIGLIVLIAGAGLPASAEPARDTVVAAPSAGGEFSGFVAQAAQKFGMPAAWIRAVIAAESGGDRFAVSPKGAAGLMQIMPQTWSTLRLRYALGADPFDARDNIMAGAGYLRELYDRYGSPGFLAAYNAGPKRWDDYVVSGAPLPDETRSYLAHLAPVVTGLAADDATLVGSVARAWTQAGLFPTRPADAFNGDVPSSPVPADANMRPTDSFAPTSGGLFVGLSPHRRPK
jgi:soluble lytic murein transglycosylase-like protein